MEKLMQEIEALVVEDARRYRVRTAVMPDREALEKAMVEYTLAKYITRPEVRTKGSFSYDYSILQVEWSEQVAPRAHVVRASTWVGLLPFERVVPNISPNRGHPAVLIHRDGWLKLDPKGRTLWRQPCGVWASCEVEVLEPEDREALLGLARLGFQVSVEGGWGRAVQQPEGFLEIRFPGRSKLPKKKKWRLELRALALEDGASVELPGDWRETLCSQVSAALLAQF